MFLVRNTRKREEETEEDYGEKARTVEENLEGERPTARERAAMTAAYGRKQKIQRIKRSGSGEKKTSGLLKREIGEKKLGGCVEM